MAKSTSARKTAARKPGAGKQAAKTGRKRKERLPLRRRVLRYAGIAAAAALLLVLAVVTLFAFVNPPTTPYMLSESRRLGSIDRQWVNLEEISPHLARAVVAAEDANFCLHWGFDMAAIRNALEDGAERGASTISQQMTKNVFLWHGRSWPRKALEAVLTPVVEAIWTKRRIIEVYLNVAEFSEGVFGAEAAARNAFRVGPDRLSLSQSARLAAVLPDPKRRSAANPTSFIWRRAEAIADGAETIRADGRADCFAAR